jgi:hypothetical protein
MASFNQKSLGGGYKGKQPLLIGHAVSGSERSSSRKHLAKAFGNLYNSGLGTSPALNSKNVLGPFKTAFNSGDILTTYIENTNSRYGYASNQVGGNNLSRLNPVHGGVNRSGNAMYSGNSKFVHDASDYSRFKKLQAINRNYNDITHGGDSGKTQQQFIRRMRR